jgi:hypothetical protein
MAPSIENEYLDVLQNIEAQVVAFYRANPSLADHHVDAAYEALARGYQHAATGGSPRPPRGDMAQKIFAVVKAVCDWRMGATDFKVVDEEEQPLHFQTLTPEEMVVCLKRLRSSLEKWNKSHGSQGYLNYINGFIP